MTQHVGFSVLLVVSLVTVVCVLEQDALGGGVWLSWLRRCACSLKGASSSLPLGMSVGPSTRPSVGRFTPKQIKDNVLEGMYK